MTHPFELKQKNLSIPEPLVQEIRGRAAHLDRFYDRIQRCTIRLEGPGAHHRHGIHSVQIELAVPGKEIVLNRHEDVNLHLALKDAFDAAARCLEEHARMRRGFIKSHQTPE
jgi:ribosome-associated translation inhibitor RaiA